MASSLPPNPPLGPGQPGGDPQPYDVEPLQGTKPGDAGHDAGDAHAPDAGAAEAGAARGAAGAFEPPPLLNDFDEDADFTRDPEVERQVGRKAGGSRSDAEKAAARARARGAAVVTPEPETGDVFTKPGMGNVQVTAAVGLTLMFVAMVIAAVEVWSAGIGKALMAALLTAYLALLHAGTGLAAVVVASRFAPKPVGRYDLAAARMLVAVSGFLLVFAIPMHLTGTQFDHVLSLLCAALVYALAVLLYFRQTWRDTAVLAVAHFGLWLIVWLGAILQVASSAGVTSAPAAGATP